MSRQDGRFLKRVGAMLAALPLAAVWVTTEARAADVVDWSLVLWHPLTLAVGAAMAVGVFLLVMALRKTRGRLTQSRRKISELEYLLNEAEASLQSEPQIMLIWRTASGLAERMVGSLRGTAKVPQTPAEIQNFHVWLENDSTASLNEALESLRQSGKPFNIGVKTLQGELLEADGRAAGGLATLRFRPLAGDRRQVTELAYDASKLAKQVERLSGILDSTPFPVWIKSKEGRLTWANQAYVRAVEAPDLATVMRAGLDLAKPGSIDAARVDKSTKLVGRARTVMAGSMRAFNIHECEIDGATAGFALDVTALEDAEKELDRHIKAHASTLDKLDTAIAIFGPDQRLRFFNQAYVALWGLEEKWLKLQPSDGEILDRLRARRALPEQANFREWKSKQLSSYTTLEMRESYWYLPDGRSLHIVCEQHPFGGVTYLYKNLTKEYQLESRYNELHHVQQETLDNLAEAVALFGSDGRLRLLNPAFQRMWNIASPEGGEKPHVDQLAQLRGLSPEARTNWQDIRFGITGLDGSRKTTEGRFSHGPLILHYRAVPLPDGNALLTFTDVSDSVRAEQALRERTEALEAADRLKTTFLANVSYEIRTPLTSIVGFAEGLDIGIAGSLNAKQREYVLDIRRSSDDLTAIIDAIIDLSAIDAGAMELHLKPVDVSKLLENATRRIMPALERRNQSIGIEMASDVHQIMADQARLEQVLGHLLSNAIGFSEANAKISMGARRTGEFVQIWVADTGRGMDSEFQNKAFDRFNSKPLPGSHRGPGLGLSIVKSFTEMHGGKVSLVSKLDQGTTVVCTLPIAGPQRRPTHQAAFAGPQQAA